MHQQARRSFVDDYLYKKNLEDGRQIVSKNNLSLRNFTFKKDIVTEKKIYHFSINIRTVSKKNVG